MPFVGRIMCAKNGDFKSMEKISSAASYSWFVWEKNWVGQTVIKWISDDYKNNYPKLF